MMRRRFCLLLPLLLLPGCRRPEVTAFGKHPAPIVVSLAIPRDYPRAETVESEYAAALRAKLATCVTVVPAGAEAPPAAADLKVVVTRIRPHSEPSPTAIGTVTGVAVGTLSAMAGNREAFFDGLFWGLWAGTAAADSRDYERHRLGYSPVRVSAVVTLQERGGEEPLMAFTVKAGDVIEAMGRLDREDRSDDARIREEEAKAFARVVLSRLQERFHWLPLPEPSYYRPAGMAPPPPPPPGPQGN